MKKFIVLAAILFGGAMLPSLQPCASAQAPVCSPSQPCVYTGVAKTEGGDKLNIKVYVADNGLFVATFNYGGKDYTLYVVSDSDGRYHINFNGKAYYFSI